MSYSFRRENYLSYRKESFGCDIRLGTEVSTWLHLRFWKDHHLKLAERIPLYSRGAKGTNIRALCWRCAECRWSGSGTKDLISGDFHSAKQRLNPGNNSLREIPIKETVASPSEQFYLTTELSNVVGISWIFVTSFGRYPCPGGNTFSSTTFPSTSYGFWQSDHRDLLRLYLPPIFVHSSLGLCCISHDHRHFLSPVRIALL